MSSAGWHFAADDTLDQQAFNRLFGVDSSAGIAPLFHKPDKSEVEVAFFRVGGSVAIKTVLPENGPYMPLESRILRVCRAVVHAKQYRYVRSQIDKFAEGHNKGGTCGRRWEDELLAAGREPFG